MAASQLDCLEDAPAGTPVTESSPEFFYSEGQRLAVEALLAGGQSAYVQCLAQDRLRPFLSNDELRHLAEAAQDVPEPAGECEGDADELSLSYWPGCSDEPIPELELGWPLDGNWKGITRAEVYTHPPGDGAPKVKELVRRKIQQAAKVTGSQDDWVPPSALGGEWGLVVRAAGAHGQDSWVLSLALGGEWGLVVRAGGWEPGFLGSLPSSGRGVGSSG
uniref:Scaffolding anchor of CK1 domain-containing protein n=1 Tax=Chelonoidis abingdonii TaxID=106734 RepID=A0A8C0IRY1_CHEAB